MKHFNFLTGTFCIGDIRPSISGECSKIKVKLRINHNGLFGIASATLIEKIATVEDTKSEGESLDQAKDSSNGEPSDSQMEWETAKAGKPYLSINILYYYKNYYYIKSCIIKK